MSPPKGKRDKSVAAAPPTDKKDKYCPTHLVVRTQRQLKLVSQVLLRENPRLVKGQSFSFNVVERTGNCQLLHNAWKAYLRELVKGPPSTMDKRKYVIGAYDKGTRSLFDYTCAGCDSVGKENAIDAWWDRVRHAGETDPKILNALRKYARHLLVGKKGARMTEEERKETFWEREYDVPDNRACAEKTVREGGTFSAPRVDKDGKVWSPGLLRVTAVKSKSKYRVVTCQPAWVKRCLNRAMKYYYNRLSRFGWLVRGDVTEKHFQTLGKPDKEKGQEYISGDYTASTDMLNLDAVMEVVCAMAEGMDEASGRLLIRSFKEITRMGLCGAPNRPIGRGSMMGSKCSFVVLCVLNAFVVDLAIGNVNLDGYVYERQTPKLINGDDSAFVGDQETFDRWIRFSRAVGFVPNVEKTGRNARFVEINSQPFDGAKGRFIPKPSFGFLRGSEHVKYDKENDEWSSDPWGSLFKTVRKLSFATGAWIISHPYVRFALEDCQSPNLLNIPRRYWKCLFRKRWFRNVIEKSHKAQFVEYESKIEKDINNYVSKGSKERIRPVMAIIGNKFVNLGLSEANRGDRRRPNENKRELEYMYGPPVEPEDLDLIQSFERQEIIRYKRNWDGVPYKVYERKTVRPPPPKASSAPCEVRPGGKILRRTWVKGTLQALQDRYSEIEEEKEILPVSGKGREMLSKMGWEQGIALGTNYDNTSWGLLEPLKISKRNPFLVREPMTPSPDFDRLALLYGNSNCDIRLAMRGQSDISPSKYSKDPSVKIVRFGKVTIGNSRMYPPVEQAWERWEWRMDGQRVRLGNWLKECVGFEGGKRSPATEIESCRAAITVRCLVPRNGRVRKGFGYLKL
ncbi:replicase [Entoleuca ourmia-like virus 1]|uniref:Replicase n=1 Tax=Entoleuca ourmia-like virus 1 TaxID=2086648 RepID=A0A2L1GGB7_9VIRU|nr:replicase [Entoleuca ourmia-like virus 1]AVD68674.2 replicase [Entoleuca ourmia-like virus 1]